MKGEILREALDIVKNESFYTHAGKLTSIRGLVLEATGCSVRHGELVKIVQPKTGLTVLAEVVGLDKSSIFLMSFEATEGLCLDCEVIPQGAPLQIKVSRELLGRSISPLGQPIDGLGDLGVCSMRSTKGKPLNPLDRAPIREVISTGVKSIDVFTTLGKGQRIGIFAGSGVGKSTLLGMIAKYASADVIVIAMVGERGREVKEFIDQNLGEAGLKRSVLVVATAGDTAVMKRQAAYSATAIAEWFRDQGKDVLLIMDSITRFAMAQREIGLATGEPMGSRGFPPSVFALLSPMLERAGSLSTGGTITAVYTVLVEGDDFNEPVSDFIRSILDGHILLSRSLVAKGVYPAIDIVNSISRLASILVSEEDLRAVSLIREMTSLYEDSKEIIDLGVYKKGSSKKTDKSIEVREEILDLIRQRASSNVLREKALEQAKLVSKKISGA